MAKRPKLKPCSICGKTILPIGNWLLGHNAAPVNNGRCCNVCNDTVVIPTRIASLYERKKKAL